MTEVRQPGMILLDHELEVPLDPTDRQGPSIRVFAREVVPPGAVRDDLPMVLYLQGGPGGATPRPRERSGWLGALLDSGYRVLLLDQRGTGRSGLIDLASLPLDDPGRAAELLSHYRADAIVADAERFREALLGTGRRWTALGQSFGGFVALHYLSARPDALDGAMITGGLPSLDRPPIDVYRATFDLLDRLTDRWYRRYPGDRATVSTLLAHLADHEELLPDGSVLGEATVRQLGFHLGRAAGAEELHEALELAFVEHDGARRLSNAFRYRLMALAPFHGNPIFSVLHESIYAQGDATRWAAERALAERPPGGLAGLEPWLTGEMVFRRTFDDAAPLRPLRELAERLATREPWPRLYDAEVLRANEVPVAALSYVDDPYVPLAFSAETADRVGNLRWWVTNEYLHDGIHRDGGRIVARLLRLLDR